MSTVMYTGWENNTLNDNTVIYTGWANNTLNDMNCYVYRVGKQYTERLQLLCVQGGQTLH
jgi:hypothetical protein